MRLSGPKDAHGRKKGNEQKNSAQILILQEAIITITVHTLFDCIKSIIVGPKRIPPFAAPFCVIKNVDKPKC